MKTCNCLSEYVCSACGDCYYCRHRQEFRGYYWWWICQDGYSHPAFRDTGQWEDKPNLQQIQPMYAEGK